MTETVDTLEASFEGVTMAAPVARPVLEGAREGSGAFASFLRSGTSVEMKAFTGVSGDSGGYAVPQEIDAVIDATLKSVSPIRAIANVVKVGSAGYRKLVTTGGTPSGWAGETGDRSETDTPTFAEIAPPILRDPYSNKPFVNFYATARLDIAVQASAVAGGVDQPPETPAIGQCWIIGDAPAGAWSGHAGMLAGWTSGGWRFVVPAEGLAVWVEAEGAVWRRAGGAWKVGELSGSRVVIGGVQVVGAQHAAIAAPSGGDVIDVQARATLGAILDAMRSHGLVAD